MGPNLPTSTFLIDVPPKIWRPKPPNRYQNLSSNHNDVDEDLYLFPSYGHSALLRPTANPFDFSISRTDRIIWDAAKHQADFDKSITFPASLHTDYKTRLTSVIHQYWDSFAPEGVSRPVLDYEFCIDTGDAKPVACRPPRYGIHESQIIDEQLTDLLARGWISRFPQLTGWLSMIVLAPKPHQEHITNIVDFIWRLCVSYRGLNAVTLVYTFPIPRCDEAIDNFLPGAGRLYWISIDAKSGFHQIAVRRSDRHKLCFAGPQSQLYTFNVMPFGPVNAPACYTALMFILRQEWQALFREKFPDLADTTIKSHLVRTGDRQIVDDVLLFANCPIALILYFECVCHIFTKWRLSFNPKKCDFFLDRVEWIGFDLCPTGNRPASSKFDMVKDWPLPTSGQSLHSFVGLLNFYRKFIPHFEVRVSPLRNLGRLFHRKPIPASSWTPPLRTLFDDLKTSLLSDPLLRRYDSSLPTFIKSDWSKDAMSFILMQPEDSAAADIASRLLQPGQPDSCTFDSSLTSARLQPVASASRRCSASEADYHSFVGEIAAGRWAFSAMNPYLWGTHFYWICDCNAVHKIATYHGPSHQLRRWAQELLAYTWTTIHRPSAMMIDVDALNRGRYIDSLSTANVNSYIVAYEAFLATALDAAFAASPAAFNPALFPKFTTKCPTHYSQPLPTAPTNTSLVQSLPVCTNRLPMTPTSSTSTPSSSFDILHDHSMAAWISVNCSFGSFPAALRSTNPTFHASPLLLVPHSPIASAVLPHLFPHSAISSASDTIFLNTIHHHQPSDSVCSQFLSHHTSLSGLDWFCPYTEPDAAATWISRALRAILALRSSHQLRCAVLFSHSTVAEQFPPILASSMPTHWHHSCANLHGPTFGDPIDATRWCCVLSYCPNPTQPEPDAPQPLSSALPNHFRDPVGYGSLSIPTLAHNRLFHPTPHHLASALHAATTAPTPLSARLLDSPHLPFRSYDPSYPAPEPLPHTPTDDPFCSGFGTVCYDSHPHLPTIRATHPLEFSAFYSITTLLFPDNHQSLLPILHLPLPSTQSLFLTTVPGRSAIAVADYVASAILGPTLQPTASRSENVLTCVSHTLLPPSSTWETGYVADTTLGPIYSALQSNPNHTFSEKTLRELPSSYSNPLRDKLISIRGCRLTYTQPLSRSGRSLILIIPPTSLRRRIFELLHSDPSSGHLMTFKTLHRIRLRFYWHRMRHDIETWIRSCPDCISSNSAIRRSSELVYTWPVSSPFAIIHCDVWQPGAISAYDGSKYFLGAMCDLTGFAIVAEFTTLDSVTLAALFMKHILLRVGFCLLVAPDAGSPFLRHFEAMCQTLKLPCKPGLRQNHQSVSVERLFRFLNKALTTAADHRGGDSKISVEAVHVATYAWNASTIDGTDIIRSVPAIGRPFRFPIDCDLTAVPQTLTDDTRVTNLAEFLRLGHTQSVFATEILRHLTEDRRLIASHRANSTRNLVLYKPGDLVFASVEVHSSSSYNRVAKASVRKRGPFEILRANSHGEYDTRHVLTGSTQTFHGRYLELCPPTLWPCEPSDGTDQRFLNINVPPLPIQLHRPFGCESYNLHFFDSSFKPTPSNPSQPLLPAAPLQDATPPDDPAVTFEPNPLLAPPPTLPELQAAIASSTDKLFFIAYRFQSALRPTHALVHVDLSQTNNESSNKGHYYCHFYTAPSADKSLPEHHRRWWPIWHRYTTGKDGVTDYHERVEFPPTTIPNASKYIAWADVIPLSDPAFFLQGPFDFTDPADATDKSRTPTYRQYVSVDRWEHLRDQCSTRGIIPPSLLPSSHQKPRRSQRKRRQPSS